MKNNNNSNKKSHGFDKDKEEDRKETGFEQAERIVNEAEEDGKAEAASEEFQAKRRAKKTLAKRLERAKQDRLAKEAKEAKDQVREKARIRKQKQRNREKQELLEAETRAADAKAKHAYVNHEIASAAGFQERALNAGRERLMELELDTELARQAGIMMDQLTEDQRQRTEDQRQRGLLLDERRALIARSDARIAEAKEQEELEKECNEFMHSNVRDAAFFNT